MRDSIDAGGILVPLCVSLQVLKGCLSTARVRAKKSAFPNNATLSTPQTQVFMEVTRQNGLLSAAQPFSKSWEQVAFCVIMQRQLGILQ